MLKKLEDVYKLKLFISIKIHSIFYITLLFRDLEDFLFK